jgi:hypothetical protein
MVDDDHAVGAAAKCAARIRALWVYRRPAVRDREEFALMLWLDEQYLATPFEACPGESRELTANDGRASQSLPSGQSQAGVSADVAYGPPSAESQAEDQPADGAAPDLPLAPGQEDHRSAQQAIGWIKRRYQLPQSPWPQDPSGR